MSKNAFLAKLGPREVQMYEKDRIPHATKKCTDLLHVNAELHRGRYAGPFYQQRIAGPGMETGLLQVAAKDLIHLGDNLRLYAFIKSVTSAKDPRIGGCTYDLIFHPRDKEKFINMLTSKLGNRFTYTTTSDAIVPQSQEQVKILRKQLKQENNMHHIIKKRVDVIVAGVLITALETNNQQCIRKKMEELGQRILDIALDDFGNTMLHYTAQQLLPEAMYFLIYLGANKHIRNQEGKMPRRILELSGRDAEPNHQICTDVMLKANMVDAMRKGHGHFVQFAVTKLGTSVNKMNAQGMTALHFGLGNPKMQQVCIFLVENGADVYAENHNGAKAIEACFDPKLKNLLISIYNDHPIRKTNLLHQKKTQAKKHRQKAPAQIASAPKSKGFFWGYDPPQVKSAIPSVHDMKFDKWQSQYQNFNKFVTTASKLSRNTNDR